MSALGAIAFLFVFIALVLWACVAVGSRHDMPEPSEPRPIRPSVDHYELDMETGDVTYHVVVTNGDRVRSMCDEELADWLVMNGDGSDYQTHLAWLKAEAEI